MLHDILQEPLQYLFILHFMSAIHNQIDDQDVKLTAFLHDSLFADGKCFLYDWVAGLQENGARAFDVDEEEHFGVWVGLVGDGGPFAAAEEGVEAEELVVQGEDFLGGGVVGDTVEDAG